MSYNGSQAIINDEQMDMLITSAGVDTAKSILEAFWRSNDEIIEALNTYLAENNVDEAAASAHALKGSAANLGATQLSDRAKTIESACRANDIPSAQEAMALVSQDIVETRNAFRDLLTSKAA